MEAAYYKRKVEIWGGIECSINRVADNFQDQCQYSGHYKRTDDIEKIARLGISKMRYPVLWEKHMPDADSVIDWDFCGKNLTNLLDNGIEPIVGLVHHGSGPKYVSFYDESFADGLARYARKVAEKFPWAKYYTPVNEPLTTARFCGLYGFWYPHAKGDKEFLTILLSECKATVLAMRAIREINPEAKLVQTEDLGKTHSTSLLKYQADFENERRWLAIDILSGKLNPVHKLWKYFIKSGISPDQLYFFIDNPCPPDILGFNYYITSERYIDETLEMFPVHTHGGNKKHKYADVEAIRVSSVKINGISAL
jgi:dTDP-4-dehydrorhamnose reductase